MRTALMMTGLLALTALSACNDVDEPEEENEEEVITTVILTLDDGTNTFDATWADPENDGDPTIDTIELMSGVTYEGSVTFLNQLETPAEDITEEIEAEAEEHQVIFLADDGISVTVTDEDDNDLPIGLEFDLVASTDGELTVTLRHLPEEDGVAIKVAGLQTDAAANGVDSLPGETDISVTFPLTVTGM